MSWNVWTEWLFYIIQLFWEVQGTRDKVADIMPHNGSILIADEERTGVITVEILPDSVPELTETYRLALTQVVGGAEIDTQYNLSTFSIRWVTLLFYPVFYPSVYLYVFVG